LASAAKEKRARRGRTRPEPTIYGNCDSWNFIVGKKACPYSAENGRKTLLQPGNKDFIHSLFTKLKGHGLDNMWAICGSAVDGARPSRMVDSASIDMPKTSCPVARFYPKLLQAILKVSEYKHSMAPCSPQFLFF
jgi:hypothetical protein